MVEFQNYNEYQVYMDNNYDEDQQITIENYISYYMNKHRGFEHHNKNQDELKNDIVGKLHEFAIIGFNLLKNKYDERTLKNQHKKH